MEVGVKLRRQREQQGWTQAALAEKMYVSPKTISNWENGRTIPDIESMLRLARVYNLSLDDLLTEGSDWVDEMKAKERQAHLERWYLLGPLATNLVLTVMLFIPSFDASFKMSDNMFLLFFLAICGNAVSTWYLQRELAGTAWLRRSKHWYAAALWLFFLLVLWQKFFR